MCFEGELEAPNQNDFRKTGGCNFQRQNLLTTLDFKCKMQNKKVNIEKHTQHSSFNKSEQLNGIVLILKKNISFSVTPRPTLDY